MMPQFHCLKGICGDKSIVPPYLKVEFLHHFLKGFLVGRDLCVLKVREGGGVFIDAFDQFLLLNVLCDALGFHQLIV